MLRVLLVDDEPLILSGIKFMVEWGKNGCELVGTARNGRQALEMMEQWRPDIVVADINMPLMNGIELLKQAAERWPHVVFIMLTNLQEFELAQEALRLHAVDYITKSQLEPETLEKSLARAGAEALRRQNLARVDMVDSYISENQNELLRHAATRFLGGKNLSGDMMELLEENGMLDHYLALRIGFDLAGQEGNIPDKEERARLLHWQGELVNTMAQSGFGTALVLEGGPAAGKYLLHWDANPARVQSQVEDFYRELSAASNKLTNIRIFMQATGVLQGAKSMEECRRQMKVMEEYAYLYAQGLVVYEKMPAFELQALSVTSIAARLRADLNSRNAAMCRQDIEKAAAQVEEKLHPRAQAIWLCNELYSAFLATLEEATSDASEGLLANTAAVFAQIERLRSRAQVAAWLRRLAIQAEKAVLPLSQTRAGWVEKAKEYTKQHLNKKITLEEMAEAVNMSASYFSAQFKKETGQNYVDYANRTKIERACELIRSQQYRMNEIGFMLGFDNAYYFSKVFRRYTGVSPTEYLRKVRVQGEDENAD